MKKVNKNKQNKFFYLIIVVVVFALVFILLVNKQNKDAYLADVETNSFSVKPVVGKVIVAKDLHAIYPKYYVVNVNGEHYSIYVYNYYDTVSQYNLEFNRLLDKIVDYNSKEKMIRYIDGEGYGTYSEIRNNLEVLLGNENIKIY